MCSVAKLILLREQRGMNSGGLSCANWESVCAKGRAQFFTECIKHSDVERSNGEGERGEAFHVAQRALRRMAFFSFVA